VYERYFPQDYRLGSLESQKLELLLQVYFAIFPSLPYSTGKLGASGVKVASGNDLRKGLAELRVYIENCGSDATYTEELLPFHALPFVQDPRQHSVFKSLFEPTWTVHLRARLDRFIVQAPEEIPVPRIIIILQHYYGLVESAAKEPKFRQLNHHADENSNMVSKLRSDGASFALPFKCRASLPKSTGAFRTKSQCEFVLNRNSFSASLQSKRLIQPLLDGSMSLRDIYPVPELADGAVDHRKSKIPCPQGDALESMATIKLPPISKENTDCVISTNRKLAITAAVSVTPEISPVIAEVKVAVLATKGADVTAFDTSLVGEGQPHEHADERQHVGGFDLHVAQGDHPLKVRLIKSPDKDIAHKETEQYSILDYAQIVLDIRASIERLLSGTDDCDSKDLVGRLLQALRWRIMRVLSGHACRDVLRSFLSGDVLAIRCAHIENSPENTPASLVDALLIDCGRRVRIECLRLINTLASTGSGRHYLLLPGSRVIAALAAAVGPSEGDLCGRRHLLGALQKLSLQRLAATRMVALGLMSWISGMLSRAHTKRWLSEGDETLSEDDVELGAGLLMNMSITSQGMRVAEQLLNRGVGNCLSKKSEPSILRVLRQLLQSPNPQVRALSNGTLYSLLHSEKFRADALSLGFLDFLVDISKHSDAAFTRQINCIIGLLSSDGQGVYIAEDTSVGEDSSNLEFFPGYPGLDPEPFDDLSRVLSDTTADEEVIHAREGLRTSECNPLSIVGAASKVGEVLLQEDYLALEDEELNVFKESKENLTDVAVIGSATLTSFQLPELNNVSSFLRL